MRVVVTDAGFADLGLERGVLDAAGFDVTIAACRTAEQVVEVARDAAGLLVQYAPVGAEVFATSPGLRVVSRYGVGVDGVDVAAATHHGVWVANVPDYGTEEVAAHTVALLLGLVRHVPFHDRAVRAGIWDGWAAGPIQRVGTMTLGLLGLGRIGRLVAARAGPWFDRVMAHDPELPQERWPEGVERCADAAEVVARSRVLSLHLPLTEGTRGSIGRDLLARAPAGGCYLVNTARGGLVDVDDLLWALDRGHVAGAALDVLPTEPPPEDHPLLRHPRAIVTPHVAWYSQQSETDLRRSAAENVVACLRDGRPHTPVNEPATPRA